VLGVLIASLLGAANAYLGFKAGQTVSATFPAAVLAIAAFRLPFFRGTVLEQNTMRTAASVGEALVAGAIFTIPAFVMVNVDGQRLWTSFNYWETSLILLVGGVLGILFIILLRRTLAVDSGLPFPESRACAEIVKAAQGSDTGRALRLRCDGPGHAAPGPQGRRGHPALPGHGRRDRPVPRVRRAPLSPAAGRRSETSRTRARSSGRRRPSRRPLIGVGYVIGLELSAINFAGGILAWFVLVPLALFLNPGFGQTLAGAGGTPPPLSEQVFTIWYNQIRPIAVGAMLVGAAWTLWRMRASILQAFRGAFHKGSAAVPLRTERDLPARAVLLSIAALTLPVALIYYHFSQSLTGAIVSAVVMMVMGFLFSAVGSYLVGLMGSSNQPVSGLALSTLILAALLMVGFGITGIRGVAAVLGVTAVVSSAVCVSGSLIQDLKVGHILGATPWKMEVAEIIATVVTAFVLVFPIVILHEGNIALGGIGIGDRDLPAPQAGLMAQMAQGIVGGEMPWALIVFGMALAVFLILLKAPSVMLIAVGMYLPPETTGAIFVGGCLKGFVDWWARRTSLTPEQTGQAESTGTLVASGLIAGESLTGVRDGGTGARLPRLPFDRGSTAPALHGLGRRPLPAPGRRSCRSPCSPGCSCACRCATRSGARADAPQSTRCTSRRACRPAKLLSPGWRQRARRSAGGPWWSWPYCCSRELPRGARPRRRRKARAREAMAYIRVVGDVTLDYHDVRPPVVRKDVQIATGSGFVIAPSGLVLTNQHVVDVEPSSREDGPDLIVENKRLQVFVGGGSWEAHVVASDPQRDLAALQMTAAELPYLPLGDSDAAEAGRSVQVLGFPFGRRTEVAKRADADVIPQVSVTAGSLSAMREDDAGETRFLQTDAAVQPGNSGGPMLDEDGYVVGVVRMKLAADATSAGAGFAIPVNDVKDFLESNGLIDRLPVARLRAGVRHLLEWKQLAVDLPDGYSDRSPARVLADAGEVGEIGFRIDRWETPWPRRGSRRRSSAERPCRSSSRPPRDRDLGSRAIDISRRRSRMGAPRA
jgi:uncharacterized oligopeptide transporter (OPT) family protein/S1-C subfamily serine protease